jgi:twinkle protein
MGVCIEKLPHSCGSQDGLQVFEGEEGYNGYCYACNTFVPDPYKNKPQGYKPVVIRKTKEEIDIELAEINECGVVSLQQRKLHSKALEHFDIKIGMSEKDGKTPTVTYFPYTRDGEIVKYKCVLLANKKMWSVGDSADIDLFGWKQAAKTGSKRLYITEGEYDAVALFTIIKKHTREEYKDLTPAVCSLPNGAGQAKAVLSKLLPKINRQFQEVVLVFDGDKAGRKAVDDVMSIAPKWLDASLPCKDANECLIEGHSKAAFNSVLFRAEKPKNTRLVWGEEIHEEAKERASFGVSYPWDSVTDLTRGIRTGETIYIGAAQKMGKSEVVNTLAAHCIKEHDWKVMVAKPEEANKKTYKLIAGKIVSKVFHDPKVDFDEDAYEQAGAVLRGKLCMVNLYQHLGWDSLQGDIVAAAAEGCKAIFIDPITNLTNGMNSADANTKLQEVAQELAAMALDLNVVIFIFCHLRNPDSGVPHDRGGVVLTGQFAGSRAMGRSCNYMFGLEGNKDPELSKEERNLRTLVLLDDREFGEVGRTDLFWDSTTTQFNEV